MKKPKPVIVGKVRARPERGPREDGRWYWRADRQAGKRREVVWTGWGSPDEAERAVRRELDNPASTSADLSEARTVGDLLDYWVGAIDEDEGRDERTRLACRGAAKRLVRGLRHVQPERLDSVTLVRYRDQRVREGDAPSTVARDLKYLHQAWRWGQEVGILQARALPRIPVERRRRVYTDYTPTRGEVAQMLASAEGWLRRALTLLWATGARVGEATNLRWSDVAADASWVELRGKGQNGPRRVPLHPDVAAAARKRARRNADGPAHRLEGVSDAAEAVCIAAWGPR